YFQTLAMLLTSKLPVEAALTTMRDQAPRPRVGIAVGEIRDQLRSGASLADAVESVPGLASPQHLALLRAGHESGRLEHAVTLIDASMSQRDRIRRVIVGQLIYPAILLLTAVVALWFLTTFVMPRISEMLTSLDKPLPWQTQVTLTVAGWLVWILPPIILAGVVVAAMHRTLITPAIRAWIDRTLLRLPIVGTLRWHGQAAMICDAVATMVEGGGDVLAGLAQAREVVTSPSVAVRLDDARRRTREGTDLGQALRDCQVLPPMIGAVVQVGMQTGDLTGALKRAAEMCIERQERLTERLLTVMSPALIMLMALTVGWVVYSLVTGMMAVNDVGGL
ncbi:MAG: type II secretion system F family protein, partial [Phycisphaerales bacterium]|nr:type II secretion system F family protein [Phycisphaerales bacterium]